jgi:hypothetical protein
MNRCLPWLLGNMHMAGFVGAYSTNVIETWVENTQCFWLDERDS